MNQFNQATLISAHSGKIVQKLPSILSLIQPFRKSNDKIRDILTKK
jgi:hypothetical protein